MEITLKIGNRSGETNSLAVETDYSIYTLRQLLRARHWFDLDRNPKRRRSLEQEIQERCAPLQETIKPTESRGTGPVRRYRPYGFMCGVFFLAMSTGPFVAVEFLDAISVVIDTNGDNALLSGAWALLTLPFAVMIAIIGAMTDAERVVKWFKL